MGKYKILLVDDEYLVRKGLRNTVNWESLGIEIVEECENGKQALSAVNKYHPDLILSDVRMPVMDGLELAENLNENKFDGAIIFYSGYSDFEYVRKALEYGVSGYILKPVVNVKLNEKLAETIAALEERRKKHAAFESLVSGLSNIKEMYFLKLEEGAEDITLREQLAILNITLPTVGLAIYGKSLQAQGDALSGVYESMMNSLENFKAIGYLWSDRFIIITGLTDRDVLCDCAERLLKETYGSKVFAMIGISSVYGKGITFAQAVGQAKKAASTVLQVGGVYTLEEDGNEETPRPNRLVEDAITIIYERYSEKLTVKYVADQLFVSESHLMHEFKEQTGKTFNECLKGYRIAKAKELLEQGKMRVNEIALAVGFSDGRYFGQVFREYVGISPSEYAELKK